MKPDIEQQFTELCGHIVAWGDRIPGFIGDMTYDEFVADELTHLAVWKCVEVLGEAAFKILRLDDKLDSQYPALQLKSAYAMRNRLSHGYSTVDLTILWSTARNFVPPMVEAARAILAVRE